MKRKTYDHLLFVSCQRNLIGMVARLYLLYRRVILRPTLWLAALRWKVTNSWDHQYCLPTDPCGGPTDRRMV